MRQFEATGSLAVLLIGNMPPMQVQSRLPKARRASEVLIARLSQGTAQPRSACSRPAVSGCPWSDRLERGSTCVATLTGHIIDRDAALVGR